MMVYDADTSAEAVVLFDLKDVTFTWNDDDGPGLRTRHYKRIKLLKASSFDRADVEIGYYRRSEDIGGLDAVIHLPTGGTFKLKKQDFLEEDYNDDYRTIKFTFPQVTEGAVIEYEYTESSKYITFLPRHFYTQDIPVVHSEYRALVPSFFDYVSLGNEAQLDIRVLEPVQARYDSPIVLSTAYGAGTMPHNRLRFAMKNIEAFKEQPYANNLQDYLAQTRFQLSTVSYPGRGVQPVLSTWPKVAEQLLGESGFGKAYNNKSQYGKVWKDAEEKVMAGKTETERAQAAYTFVASNIKWNDDYAFIADQSPNKTYGGRSGNSADLNLTLLALLREAGIDAEPLLISLRDGGAPIEFYPIVNQFDHVMVYAMLDGEPVILDANGVDRPMGLPRYRGLNHRGWVVKKDNSFWVDITAPRSDKLMVIGMTVDEAGMATADIQGRMSNYYATTARDRHVQMDMNGEAPFANEIIDVFPEASVLEYSSDYEAGKHVDKLNVDLKMNIPVGQAIDDYLYIQPFIIKVLNSELRDIKKRIYPIDFGYTWAENFISNITLPEGYEIDELPGSINVVTPDREASCRLTFSSGADGRTVSGNLRVTMGRTFYGAEEYETVKSMFEEIIKLQEATIVLRKAK